MENKNEKQTIFTFVNISTVVLAIILNRLLWKSSHIVEGKDSFLIIGTYVIWIVFDIAAAYFIYRIIKDSRN